MPTIVDSVFPLPTYPPLFIVALFSSDDVSGNIYDVKRVTRQLLNRTVAHRIIPKQESMVELGQMPLVECTEKIEAVSLSGCYKLQHTSHKDVVSRYRKQAAGNPNMSLASFFELLNKNKPITVIPHWIGGNGQPTYPVTADYARTTMLIYCPWKSATPPTFGSDPIFAFNNFLKTSKCPISVKMAHARMRERYKTRITPEPVAADEGYDDVEDATLDQDTEDLLSIVRTSSVPNSSMIELGGYSIDRGLDYDWCSGEHKVCSLVMVLLSCMYSHRIDDGRRFCVGLVIIYLLQSYTNRIADRRRFCAYSFLSYLGISFVVVFLISKEIPRRMDICGL